MSYIFHILKFKQFLKLLDFVLSSSYISESIIFNKNRNMSNKICIKRIAHPVF